MISILSDMEFSEQVLIIIYLHYYDGLQAAMGWKGASVSVASQVALTFGYCLLLLNWYFLIVSALQNLKSLNGSGCMRIEIVTKAKKSCTAFQKPGSAILERVKGGDIKKYWKPCVVSNTVALRH